MPETQRLPSLAQEDLVSLAEFGNLDVLKRLRTDPSVPLEWWTRDLCLAAASTGDLAMLQWLRALEPPVPWDVMVGVQAASRGDLRLLQWARSQGAPWDESTSAFAAQAGNIPMLEWMCGQDPPCPLGALAIMFATHGNHLDVLKWLRSKGLRCEARNALWAASECNLPMLQWMHTQDPDILLNEEIPAFAAYNGHVPMLEWASQQAVLDPCWDGDLYNIAANEGHKEVLTWLHQRGVPAPEIARNRLNENISIPILMFLGDIGVPLPSTQQEQLVQARKTFCTFHGLLRWHHAAIADPGKDTHGAFKKVLRDDPGQCLLLNLCTLPQELIGRIAAAAELQHDLIRS